MRYTVDVGPADVGARVVLRRALPDGRATDVLGVVERWDDGTVAVRRRDGVLVEVPEDALLAAKRIPPPPVRRR